MPLPPGQSYQPLAQASVADQSAVAHALAISPLLRNVALDPARIMLQHASREEVLEDSIASVSHAAVVARGAVDVFSVAIDGREVHLSSLKTGEAFGICNLFVAHDLPTRLRSRSDALLARIPKDLLIAAIEESPAARRHYLELCNEKIQFLIGRIEELTMQTTRGKLLDYLTLHADAQGVVHLPGPREELAAYLGVSRAALFREIAALKRAGILGTSGRDLCVLRSPPAS